MRTLYKKMHKGEFFAIFVTSALAFLAVVFFSYATSIGDNVSVSGTLSSTGLSTLTGFVSTASSSISGSLNTSDLLNASSTALLSATTFYGNLTIDQSATTTVTFNDEGINFDSNTFVIDPNANRVGIGTALPEALLDVQGIASSTNLRAATNLGVASTSPSTTVGVVGSGYFTGGIGAGVLNTTAGRIIANTDLGVASTSPYVALGVTGTTTASTGMTIGGDGSPISEMLFGTATYNPATAINATTTLSTDITATGIVAGTHRVFVTPQGLENCLVMTSASSTAANTIQVSVFNTGGNGCGNITPASATWQWMGIR